MINWQQLKSRVGLLGSLGLALYMIVYTGWVKSTYVYNLLNCKSQKLKEESLVILINKSKFVCQYYNFAPISSGFSEVAQSLRIFKFTMVFILCSLISMVLVVYSSALWTW